MYTDELYKKEIERLLADFLTNVPGVGSNAASVFYQLSLEICKLSFEGFSSLYNLPFF